MTTFAPFGMWYPQTSVSSWHILLVTLSKENHVFIRLDITWSSGKLKDEKNVFLSDNSRGRTRKTHVQSFTFWRKVRTRLWSNQILKAILTVEQLIPALMFHRRPCPDKAVPSPCHSWLAFSGKKNETASQSATYKIVFSGSLELVMQFFFDRSTDLEQQKFLHAPRRFFGFTFLTTPHCASFILFRATFQKCKTCGHSLWCPGNIHLFLPAILSGLQDTKPSSSSCRPGLLMWFRTQQPGKRKFGLASPAKHKQKQSEAQAFWQNLKRATIHSYMKVFFQVGQNIVPCLCHGSYEGCACFIAFSDLSSLREFNKHAYGHS